MHVSSAGSALHELVWSRQLTTTEAIDRRIRHAIQGHRTFIEQLGYHSQLEGHRGCVNCLQWSQDGSLLASGSDDLDLRIWSPLEGKSVACMSTGHTGNIFSVKFMPYTGDSLVCTGAEDTEVRLHDLSTLQTTQCWSCCQGRVKRIAVSPHQPYLCWAGSEDGCVRQFDTRERHSCAADGRCRNVLIDLKRSCGNVSGLTQCKCVDINPVRSEQIAVGALDAYARLYDSRVLTLSFPSGEVSTSSRDPSCLASYAPGHIARNQTHKGGANSSLATTYLTFSPCGTELLVNLSGDHVYLYHLDGNTRPVQYEVTGEPVHLVQPVPLPPLASYHPVLGRMTDTLTASHVAALREDQVPENVKRLRDYGNDLYENAQHMQAIQEYSSAIVMCPNWHVLYSNRATVYMKRNWCGDVYEALRDTERALSLCPSHQKSLRRRIKCLKQLGLVEEARQYLVEYSKDHSEDSSFITQCRRDLAADAGNHNGYHTEHRRQLPQWEELLQQTSCDYHQRFIGHCNTHTDIKEASFLGETAEYVAAGSDDGIIFIWDKLTGNLVRGLQGDESIVNCVQWHPQSAMLATSGIENVVRLWQPGTDNSKLVDTLFRTGKANQQRMRMDPFEIMLMRMGLRMAMIGNDLHGGGAAAAAAESERPQDNSGAFYVEQSGRCRQS